MAHTRTVYHTVHDGNGQPWPDYTVHFQLTPAVYGIHATNPESVVTVVTDANGDYQVELETGIRYEVLMYSSFQMVGRTRIYGDKNVISIVVPHGSVPISMDSVIALDTPADPDPDLAAIANNHVGRKDNPHEVTAAQLGLGNVDNTSDADKPLSTDALNALALKADDADLTSHATDTNNPHSVTAAQLDVYLTSETYTQMEVANIIAPLLQRITDLENLPRGYGN